MRNFVRSHPGYIGNGIVTPEVANDLLTRCDDIGMGRVRAPELLGDAHVLIEELMVTDASEPYLLSSLQSSTSGSSLSSTAADDLDLSSTPAGCTPYNPLKSRCRTNDKINRRTSANVLHDTLDCTETTETLPWSLQGLIDVTSCCDDSFHAGPCADDKYLKSYQ